MVYEYCDEIKNSGIDRNAFPASCTSFMEMGMYIAVNTTREVNKILEAAGSIEFDKVNKNLLTEATAKEIKDLVIKKITGALKKAWEGIKRIWAKIQETINFHINRFKDKEGNKFKNLDLSKYTTALKAAFEKEKMSTIFIDINKINNLEKDINTAKDQIEKEIKESKKDPDKFNNGFAEILDNVASISVDKVSTNVVNGVSDAKKIIEDKLNANAKEVTVTFVTDNKDNIYKYISTVGMNDVKKDYTTAKRSIDDTIKAIKDLDKTDESTFRTNSMMLLKCELAYQNLILALMDIKKKALMQAVIIAGKCIVACKPGKEDSAQNKDAK